jgi:non-heme chloroperoxidase
MGATSGADYDRYDRSGRYAGAVIVIRSGGIPCDLALRSRIRPMTESPTPVVFVHGLWLHHTSWQPWIELFGENGYAPIAPPWPGEPATVAEANAYPEPMAGYGVGEVADALGILVQGLDRAPIVIGHSFGGLLAQILLGRGLADAAVAIDPAPIKGVLALPASAVKVAGIALRDPRNRRATVALTPDQFRYGFTNSRTPAESTELYEKWVIPSPGRPLFQAATANFALHAATMVDLGNSARGPLLVTEGGKDHTVPPAVSRATIKLHSKKSKAVTDSVRFPDQDHSLTVNSDWRQVAESILAWLKGQGR